MKTIVAILLLPSAFSAFAAPPTSAQLEAETVRVEKAQEQAQHRVSNPRFFQVVERQPSNVAGLTWTVERYTHGNFGEGWLINFYYGGEVKTVNNGPAAYLERDWHPE